MPNVAHSILLGADAAHAILGMSNVGVLDLPAANSASMRWRDPNGNNVLVVDTTQTNPSVDLPSTGLRSLHLGTNSLASATDSLAIGNNAVAAATNSVAIGTGATSNAATGLIVFGSVGAPLDRINIGNGFSGGATPSSFNLWASNASSGTDSAGGGFVFLGGAGTGAGAPGAFAFSSYVRLASGSTQQSASVLRFAINGANGSMTMNGGDNSQSVALTTWSEVVNTASGTAVNSSNTLPAGCYAFFVSARVTTAISGPATWRYGWAADATPARYGTGLANALGTTNAGADLTNGYPTRVATATAVRIGPTDGVTAFTGGAVRITAHYLACSPPAN